MSYPAAGMSGPCGSPNGDHSCDGVFQVGPPDAPEKRKFYRCMCERCHAVPERTFQGSTYDPAKDKTRLNKQYTAVWSLMQDGLYRTLADISEATGFPEASVSARLRDFRKQANGAHKVERRLISRGLHQYRVLTTTPN